MAHQTRDQIMVDQPVQGALLRRVTAYWFLSIFSVFWSSAVWMFFSDPDFNLDLWVNDFVFRAAPGLLGSLLFLPLVWADVLRLSNRFVGPIQSLRTAMRRMRYRDDVPKLSTRENDFWKDAIEGFNEINDRTD